MEQLKISNFDRFPLAITLQLSFPRHFLHGAINQSFWLCIFYLLSFFDRVEIDGVDAGLVDALDVATNAEPQLEHPFGGLQFAEVVWGHEATLESRQGVDRVHLGAPLMCHL